jgi:hypothetical protein
MGICVSHHTIKESVMCLDEVTEVYDKPKSNMIGYKVFDFADGKLQFPYYKSGIFPEIGSKLVANNSMWTDLRYPHGFHCFRSLQDAASWNCGNPDAMFVKVRMNDVHTFGTQWTGSLYVPCYVCKKIVLLEGVKP